MDKEVPSMDEWLKKAKEDKDAGKCGMYLVHNGVVRKTAKEKVRGGALDTKEVSQMDFAYDAKKVEAAIEETYRMDGIYFVRVWLNSGRLNVGDDLMYVMVGGDIRPHVIEALQALVETIKNDCVEEVEIY